MSDLGSVNGWEYRTIPTSGFTTVALKNAIEEGWEPVFAQGSLLCVRRPVVEGSEQDEG